MTNKSEVLEYAHRVKSEKPSISKDELRQVLREKFIEGKDVLIAAIPHGGYGSINNPLDWLRGLESIFRGLFKLFQSEPDHSGINDLIEGVLVIVTEE
jgi:hypothetical protein